MCYQKKSDKKFRNFACTYISRTAHSRIQATSPTLMYGYWYECDLSKSQVRLLTTCLRHRSSLIYLLSTGNWKSECYKLTFDADLSRITTDSSLIILARSEWNKIFSESFHRSVLEIASGVCNSWYMGITDVLKFISFLSHLS